MLTLPGLTARALGADKVKLALPGYSMGYLPLIAAIHRGFNDDGIGENQLKVHFDLIRKSDKNIGKIPIESS